MESDIFLQISEDYYKVEKIIQFVENRSEVQPGVDEISESVHLSKFQLNLIFKRWAGVSPVRFLEFISLDYTKKKLSESSTIYKKSVLDAGRLGSFLVSFEEITPSETKKKSSGLNISYGFGPSPFGDCLMAITERGICYLGFVEKDKRADSLEEFFKAWQGAFFSEQSESLALIINDIFQINKKKYQQPFNLHIKGTKFQINVWKALLSIPEGRVASYQGIASYMGNPKAFRAVANAISVNPVAYLIPCHRVIAKSGKIHQYRWGSARKKALIGWEAARTN